MNSFINYLKYEKRASVHTITAYKKDIEQFQKYIENKNLKLNEVSYKDIRLWIVELIAELKPKTINRKIAALKSYYKYQQKKEAIKNNPAVDISSVKEAQRTPQFIKEKTIEQIIDNFLPTSNYIQARNQMIFQLFYYTGIRRSELINLKLKDVDFGRRNLSVLGKGKKERKIPLHFLFLEKIKTYLSARKEYIEESAVEYLFVNNKKQKIEDKSVYNIVKEILAQAGTAEKKSPHILRHSFASHLLNNGADINAIKELLGHSSLAATQIYTHNSIEELKKIHQQAHPKA